ncbi:hypothetical protein ABIE56_002004 [Luteibacter sp. 621]|jgi:hypothetical protein
MHESATLFRLPPPDRRENTFSITKVVSFEPFPNGPMMG